MTLILTKIRPIILTTEVRISKPSIPNFYGKSAYAVTGNSHIIGVAERLNTLHLLHMSLNFSSIASGSNGNCYYVGSATEAVLVDVGISCKEVEKRMRFLGLSMQTIKAIFISHEHSDHIRGLCTLASRYSLPVFGSFGTLNACRDLSPELKHQLSDNETVSIGALSVKAFSKYHDAAEPQSFTVGFQQFTVGIFTDIGKLCQNLAKHFQLCQAVFLEANYDDELLDKGRYPYFLKKRIRGGFGHLSNVEALDVLLKCRSAQLQYVLLAHLSKDNNCPILAKKLFDTHADGCEIVVTSRYEPSAVYTLNDLPEKIIEPRIASVAMQLSMF